MVLLFLQAREAGQLLSQEVDALSARLTGSAPTDLDSAQHLAKQAGVVSDVRALARGVCVWEQLLTGCCVSDRLLITLPSLSGSAASCRAACERCSGAPTPPSGGWRPER